jgi:predicted AlkP superfamily pyrophosphatase or phosphodiesterase
MRHALVLLCGLACASLAVAAPGDLLLLISIDGLKPEAVLDAQQHGLKLPHLKQLQTDGAFATRVRGVLPTLTFPSHTTLLTGVSPASHGILANTTFDPLDRNEHGWYWYAEDIKVPTLWDLAAANHLVTANVYWPVSVGANVTYNLPQIWRAGTEDDLKLQRAVSTPGLLQALTEQLGRYPAGGEETVADDEVRTRFAVRLLEQHHPAFMTVYLTGLDTEQHASGPFSAAANVTLEKIDAIIGTLRAAAEKAAPQHATVSVVSDHGFASIAHDVNLYAGFLNAGLYALDAEGKIKDWQAMPWPAGGSAAIMLSNPADAAVRTRVKTLLEDLARDANNGIERILSHDDVVAQRGFPQAAFLVAFQPGYEFGSARALPLIVKPANLGMHGYLPERPEMRSSFFVVGPGIARGRSLGEIDMRRIAPTLAARMHLTLATAELGPLVLQ